MASDASPIDLGDLAGRFDAESRDVYVSAYADLGDADHEPALVERAGDVEAALDRKEERDAFTASWRTALREIRAHRGRDGARGIAVFVSAPHGFRKVHVLAAPIPTRLVVDSSPYIRPLARFVDEYEDFLLVLLDGQRGTVFLVEEALAQTVGRQRTHLIGRHRNGGMSQMRYQRHRQGVVNRFYDELAEQAERARRDANVRRLVVAGPGDAKRRFVARLPHGLRQILVAVEDADFGPDNQDALVRRFIGLARAREAEGSEAAVSALRSALKTGDLAVTRPFPVVRAARDGRVDLLVIRKDAVAGGRKCEEHQALFAPEATCHCGDAGTRVDLINEAVEYTIRAEGRVEFVARDDDRMKRLGDVGAVLRW